MQITLTPYQCKRLLDMIRLGRDHDEYADALSDAREYIEDFRAKNSAKKFFTFYGPSHDDAINVIADDRILDDLARLFESGSKEQAWWQAPAKQAAE